MDIIIENAKYINLWDTLSMNPNAIKFLESNPEKINWFYLCLNPNAIELLESNQDEITWYNLSSNPAIFTYDYDLIKENFKDLGEEIFIKALHPKRMLKLMEEYGEDDIYKCYFNEE